MSASVVVNSSEVVKEAVLNWTDLTGAKTGCSKLGSNKFYRAQILQPSAGSFELLFTFGRVGSSGQTKRMAGFTSLESATKKFDAQIKSKEKKGYVRLEMRSEVDERNKALEKGVKLEEKKKKVVAKTSNYHKEVRWLLSLMYGSTGAAVRSGLSSSAGSTDEAPLGNLQDSQLDKGADILEAIEKALSKSRKPTKEALVNLTNDYLSNIPRNIDHARVRNRLDITKIVINTQERIDNERKFITLLRDAYLQQDVFAEAAEATDPVDVWYTGLGCDLAFIESGTPEYARLCKLFDEGQSPKNANYYHKLRVNRIWKLERNGEKPLFEGYAKKVVAKPDATGIVPGWHGTRTENLMGISKSGLLMPNNLPKGVHVTGKAFGMGIYHAPRWPDAGQPKRGPDGRTYQRYNGALKSMNYTSLRGAYYGKQNTGNTGFLFLEEIALGKPEVHLNACWGKKKPVSGHDYIYAQAFGNPNLAHDEIVTFDEKASRLTHLMEIGYR